MSLTSSNNLNDGIICKEGYIKKIYESIDYIYKNNIQDSMALFTDIITNIMNVSYIDNHETIEINEFIKRSYNALNNKDYVLFADLLEFEMIPFVENIFLMGRGKTDEV